MPASYPSFITYLNEKYSFSEPFDFIFYLKLDRFDCLHPLEHPYDYVHDITIALLPVFGLTGIILAIATWLVLVLLLILIPDFFLDRLIFLGDDSTYMFFVSAPLYILIGSVFIIPVWLLACCNLLPSITPLARENELMLIRFVPLLLVLGIVAIAIGIMLAISKSTINLISRPITTGLSFCMSLFDTPDHVPAEPSLGMS